MRIAAASALMVLASVSQAIGRSAESQSASVDAREPFVRMLDTLRASDSVLPPRLPRIELYAMYNREAPVPSQCYTRTEGRHNPCYVCHQNAIPGRENVMNDFDLQKAYSFSDTGAVNHWTNLFKDRSAEVAKISDADILKWIGQDNYSELPARLRAADFKGWVPDLRNLQEGAEAFDTSGFAKDGSGWVAINYKPLPSTFWPTNGATDDVMIRLPEAFRQDAQGAYSRDVYAANLGILEANVKALRWMGTLPIDERKVGTDLDGDGRLSRVRQVQALRTYVGKARSIAAEPSIFPEGTEFLHTVRYVGIGPHGEIVPSRRIKEVRYMRRWLDSTRTDLKTWYEAENIEKRQGELPAYVNFGDLGLGGPMGWQISGFIEDRNGRLRANGFEETMFCMGCHTSIGTTVDKTFSFARKRDGAAGWGYVNLRGMPDAPNVGESKGEIATYLERVGGGSEFRNNPDMQARWYRADGSVNTDALLSARDVYDLITPSAERALLLNKAYRVIVSEQSYIFGRDPTVTPSPNVYNVVRAEDAPTLPDERQFNWNIQLDWAASESWRLTDSRR